MQELSEYTKRHWDVVVIGGGATGAGTLRDLAMRGVKALLLEQRDLVHGTSSRFHGLLHSGARYAVKDAEAGRECIEENRILRRIGKHCVEETEGFFVRTPEDGAEFEATWVTACDKCGIEATPLTVKEARALEPNLADNIVSVYRVPDSAVDGFRLVWQNVQNAVRHGAGFRTYTEVTSINSANGQVTSVSVRDSRTGQTGEIPCSFVVNAAGSWVGELAHTAGLDIDVKPCDPRDAGGLQPPLHQPRDQPAAQGVRRRHLRAARLHHHPRHHLPRRPTSPTTPCPIPPKCVQLLVHRPRAFPGNRQLPHPPHLRGDAAPVHRRPVRRRPGRFPQLRGPRPTTKEGLQGMATICGGELTTYRLMGERMADLVCAKLGVAAQCRTAVEPLVEDTPPALLERARKVFPAQGLEQAESRLGDSFAATVERLEAAPWKKALLCECERVTIAEFEQVASEPTSHSLNDIRRRTRMGMGTCQGSFCGLRGVGAVLEAKLLPAGMQACGTGECDALPCGAPDLLQSFQQERWYGIRPVLWGSELRETELARGMYGATLNVDGADE